MPIDIESETLIPVRDVSKYVPGKPHALTCYRWTQRAENPLEAIRVGGRLFSSIEAIRRFIVHCSSEGAVASMPSVRGPHRIERTIMETARK